MKILFLSFPWTVDPLGIGYLSSALKKEGYTVDITRPDTMWADLDNTQPDIVGISTTTGKHIKYLDLASSIKRRYPEIKIVFGGAHPTYFPEISEEECVDYIIRGEGELSFLKLVQEVQDGRAPDGKEREIPPLIDDLDTIPFPDRELLYKFPENHRNPIRNVFTSRGCPFSCSFCYQSAFRELYKGQAPVRYRSIDSIVAECLELKGGYSAKFIFFADDEFAISNKRLEEFSEKYRRAVGLPFHCQLRIDCVTREKAKILKQAGCFSVTFAIETGNEAARTALLNKKLTDCQVIEGTKLLKEYGIGFRTENMIGLPEETIGDALKTLDFNIHIKPTVAWVSLYNPYPKTQMGEYCKELGLYDGKTDGFTESFFEDTVLKLKRKGEFRNLQRLFGLVVSFPILRLMIRVLIKLPLNSLYWRLYKVHKHFLYDRKLYRPKGVGDL